MRRVCLVLLALVGCSGETAVELADGSTLAASELQSHWRVVNYWAEWCAPCRHEIPELNGLHAERDTNGLLVLGVNYDGLRGDKLDDVIERMGIEFPVLVEDPRDRYGYERAEILPMTVLIDPGGVVRRRLVGPQTAQTILAALADAGA